MRIVFMGTPEFAVASLAALHEAGHEIVSVVTVADKPAGRGRSLRPSPVKEYALTHGLPVLQPDKLRDPGFIEALRSLDADLFVVVAFRMLPEMVWSIPRIGTFNLHSSLLPDYRGAAPINWAVINGETKTGVTTFMIDREIDTGAILLQKETEIGPDENAGSLHDRLMAIGAELVVETVGRLEAGTLRARPQEESRALHPAPKIFREDCRIDWRRPMAELHNFIRGLSPYPAAWTSHQGETVKIYAARPAEKGTGAEAGTVRLEKKAIFVQAGDGEMEILSLQIQGKRRMSAQEFLNGMKEPLTRFE